MSLPLNVLPSPQMLTSSAFIETTSMVPVTARPIGVVLKYGTPAVEMWNAPHCMTAMPSATSSARQSMSRACSAPYCNARLRDLVVVGLVRLAEVRGVGVGDRALRTHPVKRGAGVEAAGKCDADLLARGNALQNVRHVISETTIITVPSAPPLCRARREQLLLIN